MPSIKNCYYGARIAANHPRPALLERGTGSRRSLAESSLRQSLLPGSADPGRAAGRIGNDSRTSRSPSGRCLWCQISRRRLIFCYVPGCPMAQQTIRTKPGSSNRANQTRKTKPAGFMGCRPGCGLLPAACSPGLADPWQNRQKTKDGETMTLAATASSAPIPTGFPRASIALPRG
jgi:hypothetical protein